MDRAQKEAEEKVTFLETKMKKKEESSTQLSQLNKTLSEKVTALRHHIKKENETEFEKERNTYREENKTLKQDIGIYCFNLYSN